MGLERVFKAPWTLHKLRSGPLGRLSDVFCDWLLIHGFGRQSVRKHLTNVSHLNEWLATRGWSWSGSLSNKEIEGFVQAYPCRYQNHRVLEGRLHRLCHSLNRFIEFLHQQELFDPMSAAPAYQSLLDAYLIWMRDHQHAAEGTLERRRHSTERFLQWLGAQATHEGLRELTAAHVESFFIEYASAMGSAARRSMQAAMRTFLRFCFHEGYVRQHLDQAVPTWRTYKLAQVPRGLSEAQAQTVLQSVDRSTVTGRRDYAILQLLNTYGVRGVQVRALRLNDIRWVEDQILFRASKNGKDSLLPMTAAVGNSLLDYLQNARPRYSFAEVFLTCRAPYHPLSNTNTLSALVERRIRAAGVAIPSRGAHAFRHGFATRMVAEGHPLKAIADVLGHRHLSTTFIYTKVDFPALKAVALDWPGEVAP